MLILTKQAAIVYASDCTFASAFARVFASYPAAHTCLYKCRQPCELVVLIADVFVMCQGITLAM